MASEEEFIMEKDEDIAMVLALHTSSNKRPKHGRSMEVSY
jgi:hypothetical protein